MAKEQQTGKISFTLEPLDTVCQEICFWPIDNKIIYSIKLPTITEDGEIQHYQPKERLFIYEKDIDMEELDKEVAKVVNNHITTVEDVKKIMRPGMNRQLFDLKHDDKIIDITACVEDLCKYLILKYLEVDFSKETLINGTLHKFVYNKVLQEAATLRTT